MSDKEAGPGAESLARARAILDEFTQRYTPARHWLIEADQKAWLMERIARASEAALDERTKERDLALAAMKRLPEHLKNCQGDETDDDPPCVALLAYEELTVELEAARAEASKAEDRCGEECEGVRCVKPLGHAPSGLDLHHGVADGPVGLRHVQWRAASQSLTWMESVAAIRAPRQPCHGNETGYHTCGLPVGGHPSIPDSRIPNAPQGEKK